MNNSFLSFNKIVSGLSNSLNIANKLIPLYEKGKPLLKNVKNLISLLTNNVNTNKKSITPQNNASSFNKIKFNNPTFFK